MSHLPETECRDRHIARGFEYTRVLKFAHLHFTHARAVTHSVRVICHAVARAPAIWYGLWRCPSPLGLVQSPCCRAARMTHRPSSETCTLHRTIDAMLHPRPRSPKQCAVVKRGHACVPPQPMPVRSDTGHGSRVRSCPMPCEAPCAHTCEAASQTLIRQPQPPLSPLSVARRVVCPQSARC